MTRLFGTDGIRGVANVDLRPTLAYALGRRLDYYDRPAVRNIVRDAAPQDYRWSALILGIVKSPSFLMRMPQATSN